jgi:predicted CoA-substrate-specific enzyme activase
MQDLTQILDAKHAKYLQNARAVGIDIGSRAAKGVLLYDGNLYSYITTSGVSSKQTAKKILEKLLLEADAREEQLEYMVGTGYGRISIKPDIVPYKIITEISCHALGAHYLNPDTSTILDIGGQDSKAIKLDPSTGKVIEFVMNDKCAAGTGRFLEKVAQILDLSLEQLGELALKSTHPVDISSQCVVFAESEVISLRARGVAREDIAAGIHLATARRVYNLLKRIGLEDTVMFTGGVSNNPGMLKAVSQVLGKDLGEVTNFDMTLAGALGAAIFAHGMVKDKDGI